jgi:hypothetical protein
MSGLPALVYLLCAATSLCCLLLLTRAYQRTRNRLLLWSALAFVGFAVNNFLVFVDLVLLPSTIDLVPARNISSLAAIGVLLYGFVWETT